MKNKLFLYLSKYSNLDYNIYSYSINILFIYSMVFLIILFLSIRFDILIEQLLFWLLFIPLKRYTGGFHFKSKIMCIISSVFFSTLISYTAKFPVCNIYFRTIISLLAISLTYKIKTLNHRNKRLNSREIEFYTHKAIVLECVYMLLLIMPLCNFYINIMTAILLFTLLNLIVAKVFKQG